MLISGQDLENQGEGDGDSSPDIITTPPETAEGEPPAKRRKTRKQVVPLKPSAVTNLLVSQSGRHVVATTGEDKLVHVFSADENGSLHHESQR